MNILLRFTGTCLVLFFLFACGNEPGQKTADIDFSSHGQLLAGRTNHASVWTGSKMIVFGGFTTSNGFSGNNQVSGDYSTPNDVISYDPASEQWSLIKKNVGNAITGHTGVWTGTEMIVWGGVTSDPTDTTTNGQPFVTNLGRRYNPSTNVFSRITATITAPSARQGHTAVWAQPVSGLTGTAVSPVMIVWGGTSDTSSLNLFNLQNYTANGGMYDPSADAWTQLPTAGAPSARAGYASVWTGKDMIIWGGIPQTNNGLSDVNDGARYNLQDNVWTAMSTTNVPSARHNPVAVWTGSQMIVFGGEKISQNGPTGHLGDGAIYNPPPNESWTPIAAFPGFNATNTNSESTWAGVWTGSELIVWMESSPSVFTGRYNPVTNTWRTFTLSTQSTNEFQRNSSTTLWDGAEMIIWGGWANNFNNNAGNSSQTVLYNTGFKYTPLTDTTTRTSIFIK